MDRGVFRGGNAWPRCDPIAPAADWVAPLRALPVSGLGLLRGCRVKTQLGEVAAEDLRPGDRVLTRDNGYQPLRWTGHGAPALSGSERAVRLRKGALGRGMPERCLWVAPDHRLLIGGNRLRPSGAPPEVLLAAHHLTCLAGVALCAPPPLAFVHLLLDRHELILCEGTWCESLHPTQETLQRLDARLRHDLLSALPGLPDLAGRACLARPELRDKAAAALMRRLAAT